MSGGTLGSTSLPLPLSEPFAKDPKLSISALMRFLQIRNGAVISAATFTSLLTLASVAHEAFSESELATYCLLAGLGISLLGCAYFLPRYVGAEWRRRSTRR